MYRTRAAVPTLAILAAAGIALANGVAHQVPEPVAACQALAFADDFATDPNLGGRWAIHRFAGDPSSEGWWSPADEAVYLTRDELGRGAVMLADYALTASTWSASFRFRSTGPDGLVFLFRKDRSGYGMPAAGGFLAFEATLSPRCGFGRLDCNIPVGGYGIEIDGRPRLDVMRPDVGETYDGIGFSAATGAESGDHVIDDFALWVVAAPTATATPTDSPTATATPTDSPTDVSAATGTPTSTATAVPPDRPPCICATARRRVPSVVLLDALSNPGRYYGWRYPLDRGKPPSPANPPRECLTLANVNVGYHPVWNRPVWRVGCP